MNRLAAQRLWRTSAALSLALTGMAVIPAAAAADPCAAGGNPVVCENSKPGVDPSVWDIRGAGDASIQGFATQMSVQAGETVDFKVDTSRPSFRVDVYRTGWYGGAGARLIGSVASSQTAARPQPECVNDLTTGLFDCGNWVVSASWSVLAGAVSGVYVADLIADNGDESQVVFVVRDDSSHSDVVFQTSDTTWQAYKWQAYNTYGGSERTGVRTSTRAPRT